MAEINENDLISESAIKRVLDLQHGLDASTTSLLNLIAAGKQLGTNIKGADSIKAVREETEKLSASQIELQKIEKQIAAVQAKNNDEYIKATKALNEAKTAQKEKMLLGERDAKLLNAQNASLKQLEAALNKNRQAYRDLANEEARASKEGQELKKIIDTQDTGVKSLNGSLGNFKDNVGNYKSGFSGIGENLKTIAPGATSAATGMYSLIKASLAFIATPIGIVIAAIGAALYALSAYFKSSEEGQNRLNKITAVGKAIFEQFMNVVEAVGEALYNAIENPQQALKDFGNLIKENLINRFYGLLELLPALGKSIGLLFEGKFKEAGKVAFDAAAKAGLGIENITDKISEAIDETIKLTNIGIAYGQKIAAIQAKLDKDERKLIVDRAKTNLEVSKLREEAVTLEGEAKKKAIEQAIALEQKLSDKEVAFAALSLKLAKAKMESNGDDKEALKEVAVAQAALYDAQKLAYDNTLKFRKQLEALDNKDGKSDAEKEKERIKSEQNAIEAEYLLKRAALDKKIELIKEEAITGVKTKEQANKEIAALEKSLGDDYIQIQIDRVNKLLSIEGLSAEERIALEKELYKLKGDLTNAYYNQVEASEKTSLEKTAEFLNSAQKIYGEFASSVGGLFKSLSDARLQSLDKESKAIKDNLDRELELAGTNEKEKDRLRKKAAADEAVIEKKRRDEKIKSAKIEKAFALVSATINFASAVLKALNTVPPASFALAALTAALAGIQVAAIAAAPIPAYEKGVKYKPKSGLAMVGEAGSELMIKPGGGMELTPSVASIMDIPRGTEIIPHKETMIRLAMGALSQNGGTSQNHSSDPELLNEVKQLNLNIKNIKPARIPNLVRSGAVVYHAIKDTENNTTLRRSINLGKWL